MREIIGIVLAAGDSTRMKSDYPKVIHSVAGKTLIEHILDGLKSFSFLTRIIIVVGHHAERITKKLGSSYEYVVQEKRLGTADAVKQCQDKIVDFDGDVLVLAGDVPLITAETLHGLINKHNEEELDITILTGKVQDPTGYGRISRKGNENVVKIVEEIDADIFEQAIEEINSGMYCFRWPVLAEALEKVTLNEGKKEFFLTDVIEISAREGYSIDTFMVDDINEISGVNSRIQLAQAEKKIRKRINERHMNEGVTIVDPDSTFIDDEVHIGRDTIIYPFTVIEGPVKIGKDCRIGPFSHIRGGGKLEDEAEIGNFVEVKKCVVGKGTKAKHLTYLGDSTIGSKVNVGAGTIIANYDGKNKHQSEIKDNAFIGSGTILVAPVTIGKGALTGAGSVVLRGRNVPDGATVVGVPAKETKKQVADNKDSNIKNKSQ